MSTSIYTTNEGNAWVRSFDYKVYTGWCAAVNSKPLSKEAYSMIYQALSHQLELDIESGVIDSKSDILRAMGD